MGEFISANAFGLGGKGFFPKQPVLLALPGFMIPTIGVGSTGPSFNGPGQSFDGAASSGLGVFHTPSGFRGGSISPDPSFVHSVGVVAFGQFSSGPNQYFVLILNQGGLAQNFFHDIHFMLGNGHAYTLTSASSMFNAPWNDTATGTGYTTWVWLSPEAFFPPPTFAGQITVNG